MFSYIAFISILNNGVEFGEPMWKGVIIQVLFHSLFSLLTLVIIILPIFLLILKYIKNEMNSLLFVSILVFLVFMQLCYELQNEFWWGSLVPSLVATIVFTIIEYLTRKSTSR